MQINDMYNYKIKTKSMPTDNDLKSME